MIQFTITSGKLKMIQKKLKMLYQYFDSESTNLPNGEYLMRTLTGDTIYFQVRNSVAYFKEWGSRRVEIHTRKYDIETMKHNFEIKKIVNEVIGK